jgi:membrane protease YdiL (CAAX protease family)
MAAPTALPDRRKELILYFGLAYALSWAVEVPLGLSIRGVIPVHIPRPIHYLASFGPFFSALIVTLASRGRREAAGLFRGLVRWRVGRSYVLFSVGLPLVLFILAYLANRLIRGDWTGLGLLGQVDYLPPIGILPALVLWLLTFGLGEETGWRAFALPRLQAGRSAFSSSIILGLIWAGWHAPAFFYRDTYIAMGWLGPLMTVFSVVVASIICTWLYNGTRGSLLMVVLFHGLFDFLSVSSAGGEFAPVVMSAPIVFWAVRLVHVHGKANLSPVEKQTI